jgi:hypothetical protein
MAQPCNDCTIYCIVKRLHVTPPPAPLIRVFHCPRRASALARFQCAIINNDMGNSFVKFHNHGFWSSDRYIEKLAGDVAEVIENMPTKEQWLADLAAHWKLQSPGVFNGCVDLNLDEFLSPEERRSLIRELVRSTTDKHPASDTFHQTGLLQLQLLDGLLTTDASSPLDYMVGIKI